MGVLIVIAKRFDALIGPGVMLLYPLLPFWPYLKLLFCMWLVLPMFSGAAYIYSNFVRKYVQFGMHVGEGTSYTDEQRRVLQMMSLDARKSVQDYVDRFGWDSVEKAIKAAERETKKH
ncbi:hypothetical protein F2Q68_00023840 [Brassica cretica]|uniref:HVA22-like protein n=2 Tax=Brassica cretica TaxID=69181 RepID=A0ABQ7DF78_BRACR|nr:hypothetical protein F2Q68_00023840 [Brassica cretica]KAF3576111.1 hypothetical protein DY000_02028567 [Brassica cretica]